MFYTLIKKPLPPQELIKILSVLQEDIKYILCKFRYDGHVLSVEEILSEINNYIIYYIKHISSKNFFDFNDFKKFLYGLTKKFVHWTSFGSKEPRMIAYNKRKDDSYVFTDDGVQTMFEYLCCTSGSEDDFHIRSNEFHKYKNIYRWIIDYSHFFTDKQKQILKMYWSGDTVEKIGESMDMTHQAVSHFIRHSNPKIKQYIKIPNTNIQNHIVEGNRSIKNLFGSKKV